MATTLANTPAKKRTVLNDADKNYTPVFTDTYNTSSFRNSTILEETDSRLKVIEANNTFVRLFESFDTQYKTSAQLYIDYSYSNLKKLFSTTCSTLLNFSPDKISVELTYNKSILFTFKKSDYTFFFERFIDSSEDTDEVIFSSYFNTEKLPSFAGSFFMAILTINQILSPNQRIIIAN